MTTARNRRLFLLLLAGLAAVYEAAVARTLWQFMVRPDLLPQRPFEASLTSPEIASVQPEAAEAGLAKGDTLLSVDGTPFRGASSYLRPILSSRPGSTVTVEWRPAGSPETRRAAVRLQPMPQPRLVLGYLWADFGVQFFMPLFCLSLGFAVAFVRPADRRSWILLGLMISFRGYLEIVSRQSHWPPGLQELGLLFKQTLPTTWPLWMMMLGLYFPERLPRVRWPWIATSILAVPLIALSVFLTIQQWAYYNSAAAMQSILPWNRFALPLNTACSLAGIGCFFAFAGMQWGTARTPDSKRRAKLLNLGTHAAFLLSFVLVVRQLILGQANTLDGVPRPLMLLAYLSMSLFPVTLAYIILVHRAMDIRMVVRTGLQHALARRGVLLLQIALTGAALWYAARLSESGLNRPSRLMALALPILAVLLLRRAADWARQWTDRRFFREAYDAERVLSDLSDEVRTMVETQPLLERVARRISESLHVPRIAMLLREGARFEPVYATGFDSQPLEFFQADAPVAARLQHSHEPQTVFADDPQSWVNHHLSGHEDRQKLIRLETQLLLPLASRGQLLGFASLGPKLSEEPYTGTDLRLLRSVAAQTGLALENSRLTTQIAHEAARREMEQREMRIARDVQHRLFPQKRPEIAGLDYSGACRPAQSVGGDYFDFLRIESGEFGFAVGDVSGKGVPAALLMAGLVAALRGQAMNAPADLAQLMANVNRLLYDASPRSHFATLFYAQFDPSTRRLRYANAGHNPPFLFRASGDVEQLAPLGPGVGLSARSVYTQRDLLLAPGDLLIAYTDGFTEAMNAEREEYGPQRLLDAARAAASLSPDAIIAALMQSVDAFAAGAPQSDDMTIVVAKVK